MDFSLLMRRHRQVVREPYYRSSLPNRGFIQSRSLVSELPQGEKATPPAFEQVLGSQAILRNSGGGMAFSLLAERKLRYGNVVWL